MNVAEITLSGLWDIMCAQQFGILRKVSRLQKVFDRGISRLYLLQKLSQYLRSTKHFLKCWVENAAYVRQLGLLHQKSSVIQLQKSSKILFWNVLEQEPQEKGIQLHYQLCVFLVRLIFTRIVIYSFIALVHCYYVVEGIAPIFKN